MSLLLRALRHGLAEPGFLEEGVNPPDTVLVGQGSLAGCDEISVVRIDDTPEGHPDSLEIHGLRSLCD